MKKVTFSADQLDLSKETVANLSPEQLQEIEGGIAAQDDFSCFDASCIVVRTRVAEEAE